MARKFISTVMLVSFIALAMSGMTMFFLGSFEFQLQMHPVHKIFGILMSVSGCFHIYFNFKSIKNYLKLRKLAVAGSALALLLVFLFTVGTNKPLNSKVIAEIKQSMSRLESTEK